MIEENPTDEADTALAEQGSNVNIVTSKSPKNGYVLVKKGRRINNEEFPKPLNNEPLSLQDFIKKVHKTGRKTNNYF